MKIPPKEWVVERFTHNGVVKFCPVCRDVPAVALAGGCAHGGDRIIASLAGVLVPWEEEQVDETRLRVYTSADRPGSWYCEYVPVLEDG